VVRGRIRWAAIAGRSSAPVNGAEDSGSAAEQPRLHKFCNISKSEGNLRVRQTHPVSGRKSQAIVSPERSFITLVNNTAYEFFGKNFIKTRRSCKISRKRTHDVSQNSKREKRKGRKAHSRKEDRFLPSPRGFASYALWFVRTEKAAINVIKLVLAHTPTDQSSRIILSF
jgi:hypothetical protein